jgi:hypothetical protein
MDKESKLRKILSVDIVEAKAKHALKQQKKRMKVVTLYSLFSISILLVIGGMIIHNQNLKLTNYQLKAQAGMPVPTFQPSVSFTEKNITFAKFQKLDARGRTNLETKQEIGNCNGFVEELDGVRSCRGF